jgi:hypothetical protein
VLVISQVVVDDAMNALIRADAACRVALDALPHLPEDVREAVSEPLNQFCEIVGPALERRNPHAAVEE